MFETDGGIIPSKKTHTYWRRWIRAAKEAARRHWEDAKRAWEEYENTSSTSGLDTKQRRVRRYPLYKASCKTIEPAFYSRRPKIRTERRLGVEDEVALTAALIAERLAYTLIDECDDFDGVIQAAVMDFIHADKATIQVLDEKKEVVEEERIPLLPSVDGSDEYRTQDGEVYLDEVFRDDVGWFGKRRVSRFVTTRVYPAQVCYDEILHTPDAKSESEIEEKAFYFCMSEERARKRFPDKVESIAWKTYKSKDDEEGRRSEIPGRYLEGWEIYCKTTKKVYWLSEQYSEDFLDVQPDPYGLRGFFPATPFIISSKPSKSLYPTPLYVDCEPLLSQLHIIAGKIASYVDAARPKALVPDETDLVALLNAKSENVYIATKAFYGLLEKGGLNTLVQFLPTSEFLTAIQNLLQLEEQFKNNFFEWFGVPDILRGASDPVETATAQEVKISAAHDRFKFMKRQVREMVRDVIAMTVEMAVKLLPDDVLRRKVGFDFLPVEHQARFDAALALLRDNEQRAVRIEIESDSLSFLDQQLQEEKVAKATSLVTSGLESIASMSEQGVEFMNAGLQTLLLSLQAIDAGKEFQDGVMKAVKVLQEKVLNPPEPPPEPPDYEQMKLELQAQKQQMEVMLKERELSQKDYRLQMEAQEQAFRQEMERYKLTFDQQMQAFLAKLEQQNVLIESFKARAQAAESQMEEIRLAREADLHTYRQALQAAQVQQPAVPQPPQIIQVQPPSMPPINLTVEAAKPGKKITSFVRDEAGNIRQTEQVEVPLEQMGMPVGPVMPEGGV